MSRRKSAPANADPVAMFARLTCAIIGILLANAADGAPAIPLTTQLDLPPAREVTDSQLRHIALHYRAVSDRLMHLSPSQISRLHVLNPDLLVLRYINITSVYGRGAVQRIRKNHPGWLLRDRKGRALPAFYGRGVALDPAHPGVIRALADRCRAAVAAGYDGVMADETFMANRLPEDFSGVHQEAHRSYDTVTWRRMKQRQLESCREALGEGRILIANSVGYGTKYFAEHAADFLPVVDGVVAEGFRGPGRWPAERFFEVTDWRRNLDMMADIHAHGKMFIAVAKYDGGSGRNPAPAVERNIRLALATFLLQAGDQDAFSLRIVEKGDVRGRLILPWLPADMAALGAARGGWLEEDDIYWREFEHGLLLVNPSASSHAWHRAGTIVMAPHTVRVLAR
ncbi:MAG: putative glycoside hydrolase [Mariprofundaceae bacterium]|nr:putative glycoside hydrolase [Mariprofundaceae bacterium]